MRLIICEKPNVARKMAKALNDSGEVQEFKKGKVSYFLIAHKGKKAYVASAVGHLFTLTSKEKTHSYPVFDIEWRPTPDVNSSAKYMRPYIDIFKMLAKKTDEYISACDYDIEGSLIAWNVIRFICKSKKGKRMKFSTLTKEDLINAYENMTGLDYQNSNAGEVRHELDWLYGINLSRGLTHAMAYYGYRRPLSIGRVQGPALAVLAKREIKIKEFKPEPYWELWALAKKIRFLHVKKRFKTKEEVDDIFNKCKPYENKTLVKRVNKKEYYVKPNPPFDLTSLQVEAFRVFRFSPAQTLNYAQKLYEASMISYPRTSSQKLPLKLGHKKILKRLSKFQDYKKLVDDILNENKTIKPYEGKKDDPAHPAIHPLGYMAKVDKNEMKLYDLIVKRYLACFGKEAKKEKQTVTLTVNDEEFLADGSRVAKMGWMELYAPYNHKDKKELPEFKKGKIIKAKLGIDAKETQPPKRYTPASIISELERKKLGTKATRSIIIDTLYKRGYVAGRQIHVTDFGLAVYDSLKKYAPEILDEKLTRSFEEMMEDIQKGQVDVKSVIDEGKKTLMKIIHKFKKHEKEIGKLLVKEYGTGEKILGKCPKCGSNLVLRVSRKSKKQFVACSNYPKCKVSYPLYQNVKVEPTGKTCECGAPIVMIISKGKKPFEYCVDPKCPYKNQNSNKNLVNKDSKDSKDK